MSCPAKPKDQLSILVVTYGMNAFVFCFTSSPFFFFLQVLLRCNKREVEVLVLDGCYQMSAEWNTCVFFFLQITWWFHTNALPLLRLLSCNKTRSPALWFLFLVLRNFDFAVKFSFFWFPVFFFFFWGLHYSPKTCVSAFFFLRFDANVRTLFFFSSSSFVLGRTAFRTVVKVRIVLLRVSSEPCVPSPLCLSGSLCFRAQLSFFLF